MTDLRQAIVHIVRGGGAQSAKRICSQWVYLARQGAIKLERSERYGGVALPYHQIEVWAECWAFQTGNFLLGQRESEGHQDLTTHIVVSFPPGTEEQLAHAAGRDWAWSMFGSGDNGGEFDYVTAFHTDRPHPHLHVVVNRRSLTGEWLAISHRNMQLNYDSLRTGLVDAALRQGILLDATSREERGLEGPGPTTEQFRQRLRDGIEMQNRFLDRSIDIGAAATAYGAPLSAYAPGSSPLDRDVHQSEHFNSAAATPASYGHSKAGADVARQEVTTGQSELRSGIQSVMNVINQSGEQDGDRREGGDPDRAEGINAIKRPSSAQLASRHIVGRGWVGHVPTKGERIRLKIIARKKHQAVSDDPSETRAPDDIE